MNTEKNKRRWRQEEATISEPILRSFSVFIVSLWCN